MKMYPFTPKKNNCLSCCLSTFSPSVNDKPHFHAQLEHIIHNEADMRYFMTISTCKEPFLTVKQGNHDILYS